MRDAVAAARDVAVVYQSAAGPIAHAADVAAHAWRVRDAVVGLDAGVVRRHGWRRRGDRRKKQRRMRKRRRRHNYRRGSIDGHQNRLRALWSCCSCTLRCCRS